MMTHAWAFALMGLWLSSAGNSVITSFEHAKTKLLDIYADHRETIYSGCAYDAHKSIDYRHCAYIPRRANERAERIEWEHVVPAEAFGQAFSEWREGDAACVSSKGRPYRGRRCAAKANEEFRLMEADMYNLYPEIGEVNALRSNHAMAEIPGSVGMLEAVGAQVARNKFEPRDQAKGDVARTYLYMDASYPGRGIVSRKNRKLFEAWSAQDPVDAWECERARRIAHVQGNENAFVAEPCKKLGL